MNSLELKWSDLQIKGNSGFQLKRVTSESILELNIGISTEGNRCFILELPHDYVSEYVSVEIQNLTLHVIKDQGYIILELTNSRYYDLFDDLIVSLFQHVCQISEISECERIFINTFHKWADFFEERQSDILSQEKIKGVWGELFVLKNLLLEAVDPQRYNDILTSWRGPYKKGHDFETDFIDLEVKTKEITKQAIKISSEHQLTEKDSRSLELLVLSVQSDISLGKSLNDLYRNVKELVQKANGDLSILIAALSEEKIYIQNISTYDNYRYTAIEQVTYDCCNQDFPRLIPENLGLGLFKVNYQLALSQVQDFIKAIRQFEEVIK